MSGIPQASIFSPVFAMVLLTFAVWLYMYVRRIHFLQGQKLEPKDLSPETLARLSPPAVSNPSDNLKNLFEIPVLFYVLALYLFVAGQVDAVHLGAAWCFVTFRFLHSAVHCTVNVVMLRFALYLLSTFAVWFMAARAALHHFA